ncbi:uncharacterized protein LOC143636146 [Bidens hawaiensis]|uniref:uncharacterized protein LOC143636146 n=1 Tax=Bidens hawaiensis TaxID=980011 RepID=UPI0040499A31
MVTRGGRFQSFGTGNVRLKSNDGSRRSSFDHPHSVLRHLEDDSKGWETGSSASASVTDMFPMLGEIHPLMQSDDDVDDDHYDHEGVEVKDYDDHDDDDDDESDITWSGNHRNMMNLEALEVQRNQRLESLIARQKAIKNMRMMAEKNMVNVIDTHISAARNTQFDLPNNIIPRRNSIDILYDP